MKNNLTAPSLYSFLISSGTFGIFRMVLSTTFISSRCKYGISKCCLIIVFISSAMSLEKVNSQSLLVLLVV